MARISTHVLDIAKGMAARGIPVDLYFAGMRIQSGLTNQDGRTDVPLLSGDRITTGAYELVFHVGEYLGANDSFYDEITIRFAVTDPAGNYHVPLLLAPYGYSTYRGS
jgi:5-hydroxyisourate hydrolase